MKRKSNAARVALAGKVALGALVSVVQMEVAKAIFAVAPAVSSQRGRQRLRQSVR